MFERSEADINDLPPRPRMVQARCEYVQRGLQCQLTKGHQTGCAFTDLDDHTVESCAAMFTAPRTYRGAPLRPEPAVPGAPSARDVLREQSELIAKYAAHCEGKTSTCSNVATLLEYTARAKLARDMSLIYFRAATLED